MSLVELKGRYDCQYLTLGRSSNIFTPRTTQIRGTHQDSPPFDDLDDVRPSSAHRQDSEGASSRIAHTPSLRTTRVPQSTDVSNFLEPRPPMLWSNRQQRPSASTVTDTEMRAANEDPGTCCHVPMTVPL